MPVHLAYDCPHCRRAAFPISFCKIQRKQTMSMDKSALPQHLGGSTQPNTGNFILRMFLALFQAEFHMRKEKVFPFFHMEGGRTRDGAHGTKGPIASHNTGITLHHALECEVGSAASIAYWGVLHASWPCHCSRPIQEGQALEGQSGDSASIAYGVSHASRL